MKTQNDLSSHKDLNGRVAVVTGSSRGIGKRIAVRLASQGASVALLGRDEAALEDTRQEILSNGGSASVELGNLTHPSSIESVKRTIEHHLGRPSILINAAGVFGPVDLVQDGEPSAWVETIMINLVGSYLTCRTFVAGMIDMHWGRIVNLSSAAALHTPGPVNSAYGTSKAALNQFTRHLASELQNTGVTANVIHPGDVKTDMWADIKVSSERLGGIARPYLDWAEWVGETGGDDPEKAAELISSLMSDGAADVNGCFLWIKDGLQTPIPSWEGAAAASWRP